MFQRKGMQIFVTMVLLGVVLGEQELRAMEPNRVVLELPSINFTRLYNDIGLINVYNRLFNSMKEKPAVPPVPSVSDAAADEPMKKAEQGDRNQNAERIPSIYLSDLIGSQNPSGQAVETPRHSSGYGSGYGPSLGNFYGQQYGLNNLNAIPGLNVQQLQNPYLSGYNFGSRPSFGYRPSPDSLYAEYNQKYGLASLSNVIPGLSIQEIPYSQINGVGAPYNYYNLLNNRPHHYHHQYQGYGSSAYSDRAEMAAFRRFLISRYGQRGSLGSQAFQGFSGQEDIDIDSLQDDYLNDEVDDFGDDYDEGDDSGLWRKANAETETKAKAKQRKANKRLMKNKERKQRQRQQQHQESQQRSKRISY